MSKLLNDEIKHHHHNHDNKDNNDGFLKNTLKKVFHSHSHSEMELISLSETTIEGIHAVKISFIGLMFTAFLQLLIVWYTNSVALFADTIHNFSDAFSSIPLWIAFMLSKRSYQKSKYPYGYSKAEDLSGLFILALIAGSAVLVFVESIDRMINPVYATNLGVLIIAAIIGFLGNEIIGRYRINIGKKIQSEALIADGLHSRIDGYVSLSVIIGAIGTYFGFPILDPLVGIVISIMILFILKDTTKRIWLKLMDGIDPNILTIIRNQTKFVKDVVKVNDVKARWVGRSLNAEIKIVINRDYTIDKAYSIEENIKRKLDEKLPFLSDISIVVAPCNHK